MQVSQSPWPSGKVGRLVEEAVLQQMVPDRAYCWRVLQDWHWVAPPLASQSSQPGTRKAQGAHPPVPSGYWSELVSQQIFPESSNPLAVLQAWQMLGTGQVRHPFELQEGADKVHPPDPSGLYPGAQLVQVVV